MAAIHVDVDRHHSFEATFFGALLLSLIFLLCWITSARGNIPHGFIQLFTSQPGGSVSALPLALVFGAAGGALVDLGRYLSWTAS